MHPCKAQSERCHWPRTPTSKRCPPVSRRQREEKKKETRDKTRSVKGSSARYRLTIRRDIETAAPKSWRRISRIGAIDCRAVGHASIWNTSMNLLQPINQLARGTYYTFPQAHSGYQISTPRTHASTNAIGTIASGCHFLIRVSFVSRRQWRTGPATSCPLRVMLDCKSG